MKFGIRKPSIKRSISARTTGKMKRAIKRTINPTYGKKGTGFIRNPRKSIYNKVYRKTTIGIKDIIHTSKSNSTRVRSSAVSPHNSIKAPTIFSRIVFSILLIIVGIIFFVSKIPCGLIFIGIGIVILLTVPKTKNNNAFNRENDVDYYYKKCILPNCAIESIDIGKLIGENVPTYVWSTYEISGIKIATKRKNKRRYSAISKRHVEILARSEGITDIEILSITPCEPANETQIELASDMGISLPDCITTEDAKAIMCRVSESEDVASENIISEKTILQFVRPQKSPTEQLAMFAIENGVTFSAFIGENLLLRYILSKLSKHDKLAFFAYCIVCSQKRDRIGNIQDSPLLKEFHEFADWAEKSESIVKYLEGQNVNDYLNPDKNTPVYSAYLNYTATNQKEQSHK